ncbi:hypothetical protein MOMOMM089B2_17135 [Morganella morganii]
MRLLKPGVKATGMNIQHPTEQANRPATGVVTDKGVPQSDSFAKYATVDSIGQRSSYRYRENRPDKPDGRRAVLRSQVQELHGLSHGSAGARSIASIATHRGFRIGRWLAGCLMKELGLVSCQQPVHRYKRGGHEHIAIPNHLGRQFAVTEPNQVWCGDVTYSVPGVQGGHGCLNEPRVCLEY